MSEKESISGQKKIEVKSSDSNVTKESALLDRTNKRLDSNKSMQIQDKIPRREMDDARIPTKIELKTLTNLTRRPAVDIEFQDLSYTVRNPGKNGK